MNETLIQFSYGEVCAAIIIRNGKVKRAAPVFEWLMHRKLEEVLAIAQAKRWRMS